jgi:hypothetical protein
MDSTTSNYVGGSTTTNTVTYSNCSLLDEICALKNKLAELEKKFNNCKCKCCNCYRFCKPRDLYHWGDIPTSSAQYIGTNL